MIPVVSLTNPSHLSQIHHPPFHRSICQFRAGIQVINLISMISGKSKALGPPGIPWDSYGIAKFDLSPLLLGEDKLKLKSPVLPCVRPVNSNRTSVLKTEPRLDDSGSLPCGR